MAVSISSVFAVAVNCCIGGVAEKLRSAERVAIGGGDSSSVMRSFGLLLLLKRGEEGTGLGEDDNGKCDGVTGSLDCDLDLALDNDCLAAVYFEVVGVVAGLLAAEFDLRWPPLGNEAALGDRVNCLVGVDLLPGVLSPVTLFSDLARFRLLRALLGGDFLFGVAGAWFSPFLLSDVLTSLVAPPSLLL